MNKVILIGNPARILNAVSAERRCGGLHRDHQVRKDKGGEKQEHTEWHRIAFFGKLAEIAGEYLKKGSPVYVEGRIRTRKWQDKEGQEKYSTEIVADRMQLLGSRGGSSRWRASQRRGGRIRRRKCKPAARRAAGVLRGYGRRHSVLARTSHSFLLTAPVMRWGF